MTYDDKVLTARTKLIQAALNWLASDHADEHVHAAADAEYADDMLALAARELTRATDGLPVEDRPFGWSEVEVSS